MNDLLPNSLRDVAERIGFEKVMSLVEAYGGQRVWIPKQVTLDWALLTILGYEDAFTLTKYFGGAYLVIPMCEGMRLNDRNQQIQHDRRSMSISQLVAKYRIGDRQIRKILNRR